MKVKVFFILVSLMMAAPLQAKRLSKGLKQTKAPLPKSARAFKKKITKKVLLKYVKPAEAGRFYFPEGTDEAELERITKLEIKQLYRLLQKSNRPDIQLRLASLYVEMGHLIESRIYDQHTEQMELYQRKKRSRPPPEMNLTVVRNYSKKAIALFKVYLQQNPKSRRLDEVLFHLGWSYFQIGKAAEGRSYYEQLIRRFPKSLQLENAYFHLGEYYFDSRKWKTARSYYDKASRFRSKFYNFSLYKIGWSLYNEGRVESAMKFMVRLVRESAGSKKRFGFVQEALNDLSSFYIYSKHSPESAQPFFSRLISDEKKLFMVMEKLAYGYKDIGNQAGLRVIFSRLIETQPAAPKAYDYKYQIVQAYAHSPDRKIFNKEFREWLENYGSQSAWGRKNRRDKALLEKAFTLMETTLRNYVFSQHHSFKKTKSPSVKNQALFGYKEYTRHFPKSKWAADIYFHYGDLLFDLAQFLKSAQQYEIVARRYPKSDKNEMASLNWVLALEKKIPSEKEVKALVKKNPKGKVPFPAVVGNLKKAVEHYIGRYPKGKKVPDMVYLMANLHSEYRHHDEALSYWMRIVENHSSKKSPILEPSVHSILDTYNLKKDYASLRKVSETFLKNPVIRTLPVAGEIRKILRQLTFTEAQKLAGEGKLKASAKLYEDFAVKNKSSKLAVPALFNAALNYKKIKDIPKSIELYTKLYRMKTAGDPKIKKQVMKELPVIYQTTGRYLRAANLFDSFASSYPKDKSRLDFLYNGAIIYDGLHLNEKAAASYLKYYQLAGADPKKNQIYEFIGKIRARQGQFQKAIGNYNRFISSKGGAPLDKVKAAYEIARLHEKLGQKGAARQWYKKTIQFHKKWSKGAAFAAPAQFQMAYGTYKKFRSIRIPKNPAAGAQAVKRKLALLETLGAQIKDVIRFDYGPEIISALTLMGLANHHLARSIIQSPKPRGLSREDLKKYKEGLKKTAQPFEDNAKKYLNQALDKSDQIEGWTPWLKDVHKVLTPSLLISKPYFVRLEGLK